MAVTAVSLDVLTDIQRRISSITLRHYAESLVRLVEEWSEPAGASVGGDLLIGVALSPTGEIALELQFNPDPQDPQVAAQFSQLLLDHTRPPVTEQAIAVALIVQLNNGCGHPPSFSRPFQRLARPGMSLEQAIFSREKIPPPVVETPPPRDSWWSRLRSWFSARRARAPQPKGLTPNGEPANASMHADAKPALVPADWLSINDLAELRRFADEHADVAPIQEHLLTRLLDAGSDAEAITIGQRLVDLSPDRAVSYGLRAAAYRLSGKTHESLLDYSRAIELDPTQGYYFYSRGRILFELGGVAAAEEDFTRAVQLSPIEPDYWLERALARAAQQKFAEAREDIARAIAIDPYGVRGYSVRANTIMAKTNGPDDIAQAVDDLAKVLEFLPDSVWALTCRANLFLEQGKFQLAIEESTRALDVDADDMFAHGVRGFAHQQLGELQVAFEDCSRAIELGLQSPMVFLSRAACWHARNELESALADCNTALELDPKHAAAYHYRGIVQTSLGEIDAAMADFAHAADLAPEWNMPVFHRAELQRLRNDPQAAVEEYTRAIELAPRDTAARVHRALAYIADHRPADALLDLNHAIELDHDCTDAYLHRGWIYIQRTEYDAALADLNRAAQLDPSQPATYHLRGQVFLHLRRSEEAIRDFNELVRLCPDSVQALLIRSAGWTYLGRQHDAERDLKEATRLAPEQAHELRQQQLLMEASVAHQAQDYDTSIAKATELLEATPDHAAALRIRAGSHWYAENFVEALEDFTRLMDLEEMQEETAAILSARGQVYGELGEYELALEDLNRAVESARRGQDKVLLAYSLNGRATAHVGMHDFPAAERDFQDSLALCPNNGWLHYNIGLLAIAQQRPATAVEAFRLALTCDNPPLSPRKKQKAQQYVTAFGA